MLEINYAAFTPLTALAGGMIIGLAAAVLLLTSGKVMGASSIVSGALRLQPSDDRTWRWWFLAGLIGMPLIVSLLNGSVSDHVIVRSLPLLITGGLITGFGVIIGSGCTSGHGICGIGRLSPRSILATVIFMAFAIATTSLARHVWGVL